jgi:hypothetical protein
MTTQCKMMDGFETPTEVHNVDRHGYVKSSSKYFVTDNLEVFPSSNSLALLKKLKVENMSSLDSIDLRVGTDEVTNQCFITNFPFDTHFSDLK